MSGEINCLVCENTVIYSSRKLLVFGEKRARLNSSNVDWNTNMVVRRAEFIMLVRRSKQR